MAAPLSEIIAIVRDVLGYRHVDLSPETRFHDLTDWDSMDLITVVVEAECRYNLRFAQTEIEGLTTIGNLVGLIAAKQAVTVA